MGDELVQLENKQVEDYLYERTKYANLSRDAAIGFRAEAKRDEIAIQQYLEGEYRTQLMTMEKELSIAEERLNTANSLLAHAQSMLQRGYVSELDVEQKELAVTEATLSVQNQKTNIDVLKRFTKKERLEMLKGNWESSRAAANGHEEVLKMDQARMAQAEEELAKSVIRAEKRGLVVYPKSEDWKSTPDVAEGATVHHDQELLLMPDLSQMQVKVGIHESMIDKIAPGLPATVTLPGRTLKGKVVSVASTARPAAWYNGNMVKYDAIIKLPSVEGLKPGMSAQVDIVVAEHVDVFTIPLSAVGETDEGTFCWVVREGKDPLRQSVQLSDNNESHAVVVSGLTAGERVLVRALSPVN